MGQGAKTRSNSDKDALNAKQLAFVEAYCSDERPNATQAAIKAGYSKATAKVQGSRLLTHAAIRPLIADRLATKRALATRNSDITLERTLTQLGKSAFFDPRKFFDERGHPIPIERLDDVTAFAIAGFEVATELEPGGEDAPPVRTIVRKVRLIDRSKSLDMLMKHLGGYKKDNEQGANALANAFGVLMQAIEQRGSRLPIAQTVPMADVVENAGGLKE